MEYKNDDYVLKVRDDSPEVETIVRKYDAFLDLITTENFEHVREAVRQAVKFFISQRYANTEVLAREHYATSEKMKSKYPDINVYLDKIPLREKKAMSIDLATGTGKSWVIYGVAQILLAEGLVDKVLVLCPSLTIEEELKKKFLRMSGDAMVSRILQELGALYSTPEIKNANVPILAGDICVENIHAVYERTGSSIRDSFIGRGERTLVISDEAHHIFSPGEGGDTTPRRWMEFLTNPEFGFAYHLGLTGTAYIRNRDNDYFHDVIYRYGLKQAMENGVIKTIDYVLERERERIVGEESGYDETYQNHQHNRKKYEGVLKPLTIIITATIFECIREWFRLVEYIAAKEKVTPEAAAKKVIWVTSGLPANTVEKEEIQAKLPGAEKIRKENLQALKTVDAPENPVEWILSVAMLTEGWDVKNVFQIVPHSNKAFDSKLLIAQVLGRGLRIPNGVTPPVQVIVNNHTRWTEEIANLYKEVVEIENRVTWGYDPHRARYVFPLFNLEYAEKQYAVESKKKSASAPTISVLHPQERLQNQAVTFSLGGVVRYDIAVADNVEIEDAARQIKLFLKDKDPELAEKWPFGKIEKYITKALADRGYDTSFVSKENLAIIKQGFGPMFRALGKEVPRIQLEAEKLVPVTMVGMSRQSFSEGSIKGDGYLFYDNQFLSSLSAEERSIIGKYIEWRNGIGPDSTPLPEIQYLVEHLFPVSEDIFKTSLSATYVSYGPERDFTKGIFTNAGLFDAFIKSPDKGFYSIPYSYKPTEQGLTHVKHGSFNPDFFLRVADSKNILAVEIKSDEDTAQENKAKYRDAREHFEELNRRLEAVGEKWRYHFYFLSPENYSSFFQAVRDGNYRGWKSELMQLLER